MKLSVLTFDVTSPSACGDEDPEPVDAPMARFGRLIGG